MTQPRRVRYSGMEYTVRAEADGWLWLADHEEDGSAGMLIRHEIVTPVVEPQPGAFVRFPDGREIPIVGDDLNIPFTKAPQAEPHPNMTAKGIGQCSFCDKAIMNVNRHLDGRPAEYVHAETGSKRCHPTTPAASPPATPKVETPPSAEPDNPSIPTVDEIVDFVEDWATKGLATIKAVRALHDTTRKGK